MINRAELKQLSKTQLSGKWGSGVLITFIYFLTISAANVLGAIPVVGFFLSLCITAPLGIGLLIAFITFVKSGNKLDPGDLFKAFSFFGKSLGATLWLYLWVFLWMLLLIIPGIVKAFAYSQTLFIIANNPNVKVVDSIKISMKMTNGYKFDLFVLALSFLGWALLCCLTLGIGFLWLAPYMNATYTNVFFKLKETSIQNGVCTENEFNGI